MVLKEQEVPWWNASVCVCFRINGCRSDDNLLILPPIQSTLEWLSGKTYCYFYFNGPQIFEVPECLTGIECPEGHFSFYRQQTSICCPRGIYHRALRTVSQTPLDLQVNLRLTPPGADMFWQMPPPLRVQNVPVGHSISTPVTRLAALT